MMEEDQSSLDLPGGSGARWVGDEKLLSISSEPGAEITFYQIILTVSL